MLKICIRSFGGGYIEKAILVFLICSYFKQLSQALNITALSYANIISFVSYICNPSIGRAEVLCLFIICSVNTAYPYLLCINSYLRLHSNLVWCYLYHVLFGGVDCLNPVLIFSIFWEKINVVLV